MHAKSNYSTIQKVDFNWYSYVLLDQDTLVGVSYWSLCICDVKTGVCKPFNEKDILENNSTAYYDENGNAVSFSGVLKINKFQFLSWHDNGSICLWNNEKKSKIIFKEDSAPITSVKLINEAQFISCSDHDIRIWNIKTQECEVLQGHNDEIYDLIIIDNDRFLSYSKDTTFRIWDVNNNSLLFDQIKIYCDEISSTKEFQQQLKEENALVNKRQEMVKEADGEALWKRQMKDLQEKQKEEKNKIKLTQDISSTDNTITTYDDALANLIKDPTLIEEGETGVQYKGFLNTVRTMVDSNYDPHGDDDTVIDLDYDIQAEVLDGQIFLTGKVAGAPVSNAITGQVVGGYCICQADKITFQ